MSSLFVALRAALFAIGFVTLWGWVALSVERLDRGIPGRLPDWAGVPGLAAMAVGAALAVSCIATFAAVGRGTPAPFDPPRRFVAAGPYRYVRNPMYVGGFLVLAGWALYRQSPSVLLLAAGWLCLLHLVVVAYEEPTLRGTFGVDYQRYLERVPRWIPRAAAPLPVGRP
jgi:protein-S-isoprenylcysteine O-methyltransferase Ste14